MISQASAPGKVILFGEHFVVYGTRAIAGAIELRVTVRSQLLDEKKIIVESNLADLSVDLSAPPQTIQPNLRPICYIANKILSTHGLQKGMKITIDSQIPAGVGLGSSSACCVAAAASISKLVSDVSEEDVLKLSIEAEQTILANASGIDNTVCMYGGLIEYNKRTGFRRIEDVPPFYLLVINSGLPHSTKEVVERVRSFREKNPSTFDALSQKESLLITRALLALQHNDLKTVGVCMKENQRYLEQIGIANDVLKEITKRADPLTLGSKITGAGDGGCIIALIERSQLKEALDVLGKDYDCFATKIDTKGMDTF